MMKLAFSVYRQYDRAIDTSDIYKELSARLREELDYDREAAELISRSAMSIPTWPRPSICEPIPM